LSDFLSGVWLKARDEMAVTKTTNASILFMVNLLLEW
jgi:hypothetical protein